MTLLITLLATPFALALVAVALHKPAAKHGGYIGLILGLPMLAAGLVAGNAWVNGEVLSGSAAWIEPLNIEFALHADGLSWMLASLVLIIGAAVVTYGGTYLGRGKKTALFFPIVLAFAGSMVGIALSDDLILLFIFWELTSITSFLLIGMNHEQEGNRHKANQALLTTAIGGLALLAGAILLREMTGTHRISELLPLADTITSHQHFPALVVLIFLAAFTKSAQFPFHYWLPNAMAGPTPVSAYLHSATMVKAGVFLVAKLNPSMGDNAIWQSPLLIAGTLTLVLGTIRGWRSDDLKGLLAASTLGALGTLMIILGHGSAYAASAFVVFFMAHAFYKAPLFMIAGALEHATHTKKIKDLGGLRKSMPLLFLISIACLVSFAGLPPTIGFLGKEYLYKAMAHPDPQAIILLAIVVPATACLLVLGLKAAFKPFVGQAGHPAHHRLTIGLILPPALLALAGLSVSFLATDSILASSTANALGMGPQAAPVVFWSGFNAAVMLSIATLTIAAILYPIAIRRTAPAPVGSPSDTTYDASLKASMLGAARLTRLIQAHPPAIHVYFVFGAAFLLLAWRFFGAPLILPAFESSPSTLPLIILSALVCIAACVSAITRSRIFAVVSLGLVGLGLGLFFAWFSAPDLALTQILVEALTVVLLVFAIPRLPEPNPNIRRITIPRGIFAIVGGVCMTLLVLSASTAPLSLTSVSDYHLANSYSLAKGSNVVNVILVDFRALDTFGEIIVLGIAAFAIFSMLTRPPKTSFNTAGTLLEAGRYMLMPVMLAFSLIFLWRGHNLPGGGFIGALTLSLTAAIAYLIGTLHLRKLTWGPNCIVAGLLMAGISTLPSLFVGRGWFTSLFGFETQIPVVGKFLLGTPLLFDIGVYVAVVGFALTAARSFAALYHSGNQHPQ